MNPKFKLPSPTEYCFFYRALLIILLFNCHFSFGISSTVKESYDETINIDFYLGEKLNIINYGLFQNEQTLSPLSSNDYTFDTFKSEEIKFKNRFKANTAIKIEGESQFDFIKAPNISSNNQILDFAPPNAVCKNITVALQPNGTVSIVANDVDGGSTDDIAILSRSINKSNFNCNDIGPNNVVLTVRDLLSSDTCTAIVTVIDDISPSINCAAPITVNTDSGTNAYNTSQLTAPSASDNCSVISVTPSPSTLNLGNNTVTWTALDSSNNSITCTQNVTVVDNENPTANCQNFVVALNSSGNATIQPSDIDNNSTDNDSVSNLSLSQTTFDCSNVGDNTVTLTVTDANGNSDTCTATVTVEDNIAPVATCQNITVQLDANGSATIAEDAVNNGSADACGPLTYDTDITTFDCANVGANTVTLTVTDANGNSDTCTATVTVEDNVKPNVVCQNITVQLDANGTVTIPDNSIDNGSSDACGIDSFSLSQTTFDCSNVGDNSVILTVTDNNGNFDTCSATITVIDSVKPEADCKNITVQLDATGNATIAEDAVNNNSADSCGGLTFDTDITTFNCSNIGDNTVTLTVTDSNGNFDTCTAIVTVEDNVEPVVVCRDITVELDINGNALIAEDAVNDGSSDACGGLTFDTDITSFTCDNIGDNNVTLTVTDINGNKSICTAVVTIEDNIQPNVVCKDITIQLDSSGNATITDDAVDNGSSDSCGPITFSTNIKNFNCNDVGANIVELTVTDANGNSSSCDATVTVEDNIAPTVVCKNITVELDDNGFATIENDAVNDTSSDACGSLNYSTNKLDFDCSDLGDNNVTLTVTDINGNTSSCNAIVTIVDRIKPVKPTLNTLVSGCSFTPPIPTTTDNCSGTISGTSNRTFPITSSTIITWSFRDDNDNITTANQTVTISPLNCDVVVNQNVSCFGGSDGIAAVDASGGNAPYTFDWGALNPNALEAGTHSVTVTDAGGCTSTCAVTITEPNELTSNISNQTNNDCVGDELGSVQITGVEGTPPYMYSFEGGTFSNSGNFSSLAAGTYSVTIRDSNLCTTEQIITITEPAQPVQSIISYTDEGCHPIGSIGVTVSATGGSESGYEYRRNDGTWGAWTSNGVFGPQADGNYLFQSRDINGCLSEIETVSIANSTSLEASITSSENVKCFGESTGSANTTVSGGKGPFTYHWDTNPVQTTANAFNLPSGTYTFTVTDSNGCSETDTVTISEEPELQISTNQIDVSCFNGTTGSITSSASGGKSPYKFNIDNSSYTDNNTFNNLEAGKYLMGVLDALGCEKQVEITIGQPTMLEATIDTEVLGCHDDNAGRATVNVTGGAGGYTYSWNTNPVQTTQTATGLSSRNYTVTITDANGCSINETINYQSPTPINISFETQSTSGPGFNDGTATAIVTGGSGNYSYQWNSSPTQTTQQATGLEQGIYTVTVTDTYGCTVTGDVIVADRILIEPFQQDVNYTLGCANDDDIEQLTINPQISGGYGNLTYTWKYGQNSTRYLGDDEDGFKVISYNIGGNKKLSVEVRDESGQVELIEFSVFIDSCIDFVLDCDRCTSNDYQLGEHYIGDADGNPIGTCDNPGETVTEDIYIWFYLTHNDNTNYSLTVVAEYATVHPITGEVVLETVNDCLYEGVKIGTEKANLFIDDNYVCGSEIIISDFLISWNKIASKPCGQNTPKCDCYDDDLVVSVPMTVLADGTDILCFDSGNDGAIDVSVFGGEPPFTYNWSTNDGSGVVQGQQDQTGLSEGTYNVSVTDSYEQYDRETKTSSPAPRTITRTVVISRPPEIIFDNATLSNPLCFGDNTGSITASASGGTGGLSYAWNTNPVQNTATASNLYAGTYTVTVTDANGCTKAQTHTLTEPPLLEGSITSTNPQCYGGADGSATVVASGGTPGYSYSWNTTPVQNTATASSLRAGNYTATITDNNGCTREVNVTIGQPTEITATTSKTDVSCFGAEDGTATVEATGGTGVLTYLWDDALNQTSATATGLDIGTYNVIITDENGCQAARNITILQPEELIIDLSYTQPDCYNDVEIVAAVSGGSGQYNYSWNTSPVQNNQNAIVNSSGNYILTVTDSSGCTQTASIDIDIPLETFADAGSNVAVSSEECGFATIELNGSGNDSDGNNLTGTWSVVSGTGGIFSDVSNPNSNFDGNSGETYVLRYSVNCAFDDVQVTFADNCSKLDFDGINDYVNFYDNNNFSGAFTIEMWIKSHSSNNNIQTIYSKRDADNLNSGYDLRLKNNFISFNFNNDELKSPFPISTNRWYHSAVSFDGSTYSLYIDGILVNSMSGSKPNVNSMSFLLGSMDNSDGSTGLSNNFHGWMDEFRIWNIALEMRHIRQMMNQEIKANGSSVRGEIIPIDIPNISWSNLSHYYQMKQPSDVVSGDLLDNKGTLNGKLFNINTWQDDTAPLPYLSIKNGKWNNIASGTPWLHGSGIWDYPNANGIDGSSIDWNIVKTNHNITMDTQDLVLLGLLVDGKELTITNTGKQDETNIGHGLTVTHYLKLNGIIDLVGHSQLVQKRYDNNQVNESLLEQTSSGYVERDQQGTPNLYNYNYWSSPVSEINTSTINKPYSVLSVMKDGSVSEFPKTPQFNSTYDATGASNPVNLSNKWIYAYKNFPADTYAAWEYIGPNGEIPVGLAYTMKGSGVSKSYQNYTFMGKPNNGTIMSPVSSGNQALVGNPYPSSMDANEFIRDNIPGENANPGSMESIDGSLYFWDHYESNETHVLRDYQGGYAVYNLSGGVKAFSPALVSGLGSSNKLPGRYIPVGQGFFVTSSPSGGSVTFMNKHRVFKAEDNENSSFLRNRGTAESEENEYMMKRVKLNFALANGTSRELLLSFSEDNFATDHFDYGYDALNNDLDLPIDISWMVDGEKCVIQGVGKFEASKQFPLGLFITQPDKVKISLVSLENFEKDQEVYVYDALLGTTTPINEFDFEMYMDIGTYLDRFFITFEKYESTLFVEESSKKENIILNYFTRTKEIYVNVPDDVTVKQINLFNIIGQRINSWNALNAPISSEFRIRVNNVASGNYIIQLETDSETINKKVIISE